MADPQITVALPIGHRPTSFAFYREAFGLAPVGEPGSDGIPEPLAFVLNEGTRLMLAPAGGFAFVIGDHEVADGQIECLLGLACAGAAGVDELLRRAGARGTRVVAEAAERPWGYTAVLADPDGHLWELHAA